MWSASRLVRFLKKSKDGRRAGESKGWIQGHFAPPSLFSQAGTGGAARRFQWSGEGLPVGRRPASKKGVFAMAEYLLGVAILLIRLLSAVIDTTIRWRSLEKEEAPRNRRPIR
jgi:hypothetical protein